MSDPGERLRHAADIIRDVSETAPEGDFGPETLAEYEAKFGEVPSIRSILTELEQTTRTLSILVDAHAEAE